MKNVLVSPNDVSGRFSFNMRMTVLTEIAMWRRTKDASDCFQELEKCFTCSMMSSVAKLNQSGHFQCSKLCVFLVY